jgi:hypothetical protein
LGKQNLVRFNYLSINIIRTLLLVRILKNNKMANQNLIAVIILTIIVNAGMVYVSYLTYQEFRLSFFHVIIGSFPLVLYLITKVSGLVNI